MSTHTIYLYGSALCSITIIFLGLIQMHLEKVTISNIYTMYTMLKPQLQSHYPTFGIIALVDVISIEITCVKDVLHGCT